MTAAARLAAILAILRETLDAPRMDWRCAIARMEAIEAQRPVMPTGPR